MYNKQITILNIINDFNHKKGFSIIRLGNVETNFLQGNETNNQLRTNAGFYGSDEDLKFWRNTFIKSLINSNIIMNVISCSSFKITRDFITQLNIWKPQMPYIENPIFYMEMIEELHRQNKNVC